MLIFLQRYIFGLLALSLPRPAFTSPVLESTPAAFQLGDLPRNVSSSSVDQAGQRPASFAPTLSGARHRLTGRVPPGEPNDLSKRGNIGIIPPAWFHNDMNRFMSFMFQVSTLVPSTQPLGMRVDRFQDRDVRLGSSWLFGCTVLIVASRRGVYFAHYYDEPAFFNQPPISDLRQKQKFREIVIRSLTNAPWQQTRPLSDFISPNSPPPGFGSTNTRIFTPNDHVQALIFSPRKTSSSLPGGTPDFFFDWQVRELRNSLQGLLPRGSTVSAVDYQIPILPTAGRGFQTETNRLLEIARNAAGKILVQYAPTQGYKVYASSNTAPILSDIW